MPKRGISPDKSIDKKDSGDDIQRRYRYQDAYAALISLELLADDPKFKEVFCEQHEDILVRLVDDKFIGIQVKTRDIGLGPFKFGDPEILKTLTRFIESEKEFPNKFRNFEICSNCDFWRRRKNASNLEYFLKLIKQKDFSKRSLDIRFSQKIRNLSIATENDENFVLSVLRKVRTQKSPDLDSYEKELVDKIAHVTNNANLSYVSLQKAANSLIATMFNASSLSHDSPRRHYFSLLEDPKLEVDKAIIENKRVTKDIIQKILSESLNVVGFTAPHRKIDFTTQDDTVLRDNFREYATRIVSDYDDFSSFERRGVKPLIEQFSKFNLKVYYVPIKVQNVQNRIVDAPDDLVDNWMKKDPNSGLLLLGDYGTGKSTLCAYISYLLAKSFLGNTNARIPLFIPLRNLSDISEKSILSILNDSIKTDWKTLRKLAKSGRLVLIFDGFDEITKRTDWQKTQSDFNAIVNLFCIEKSKVIVTCRTHFFLKDSLIYQTKPTELMRNLLKTKNFRISSILPFEEDQILDLIGRRTEDPKRIWEQIKKTYNLRDLCKRPLLIDMIISSLPKLINLGIAINAARLYVTYTEDWISRDDWRSQFSSDEKSKLMEKIASDMFFQGKNDIYFTDFRDIIKREFKAKSESDVADFYDYDIRTCSFFNRDSKGFYGFMHRSFLEFFVAQKIAKQINSNIKPSLFSKTLPKEIIYFAGLMINPNNKEILYKAIYGTRGKPLDDYGIIGGNALKLLIELEDDLSGKDFSLCVFREADISSHQLQKCKFDQAKFKAIIFEIENIQYCSFKEGYFESCQFRNCRISDVNFAKASFVNSMFEDSNMTNCPMNDSRLISCCFADFKIIKSPNSRNLNFENCDASSSRLGSRLCERGGIRVVDSNFQSSKFINCNLLLSEFIDSNFHGSNFINFDLGGTCIANFDFTSSVFNQGSISFASLINNVFDDSHFNKVRFFHTFVSETRKDSIIRRYVPIVDNIKHHDLIKKNNKVKFDQDLPALCLLNRAVEKLSITDNVEEKVIQTFYAKLSTLKSKGRIVAVATCLYGVTKKTKHPFALTVIAKSINVNRTELAGSYRKWLKIDQIKPILVDPKKLIDIYAAKLKISEESVVKAKKIIDVVGRELQGRQSATIAASSLYLACREKEKIKIVDMAAIANLSKSIIGKVYKLILKRIQARACV